MENSPVDTKEQSRTVFPVIMLGKAPNRRKQMASDIPVKVARQHSIQERLLFFSFFLFVVLGGSGTTSGDIIEDDDSGGCRGTSVFWSKFLRLSRPRRMGEDDDFFVLF